MNLLIATPRRRALALLGLLAAAVAVAVIALTAPNSSFADANPNTYDCRGHVEAGAPEPQNDVGGDTQVKYVFACNGPILGYQIQSNLPDTSFDTETFGVDQSGASISGDAFTCNADVPGVAINCLGTYRGAYDKVAGQFTIAAKLCHEPRTDPLLTVFYATADAQGKVTPAISGPYDLGRPRGCPASKYSGQQRIPEDGFDLDAPPAKTTTKKSGATR